MPTKFTINIYHCPIVPANFENIIYKNIYLQPDTRFNSLGSIEIFRDKNGEKC